MNNTKKLHYKSSKTCLKTCTKGGIKIHEHDYLQSCDNYVNTTANDQTEFYNKLKSQNKSTGIRITKSENEYIDDPFSGLNPFSSYNEERNDETIKYDKKSYERLDLNIDSYSREELFKLFGLKNTNISEDIMKECKKVALKTHPDKSQLEPKYFLFFSAAYKKIHSIYEFQNKTTKKVSDTNEYFDTTNGAVLDKMFENDKALKNPKNFNNWFNTQFEKHKLDDNETGYGNWLKSDEDIVVTPNVSKSNMGIEMEKHKKHVQSLTTYKGVTDYNASSVSSSALMDYNSNFTSGSLFSNEGMGYTDLRQAYAESVIPVTENDFNKIPKFKSIDEYKRHRETSNTKPIDKEESMRQLYQQNKQKDEESSALAFYYAQQSEKIQKNQDVFWSGLKQVTNR